MSYQKEKATTIIKNSDEPAVPPKGFLDLKNSEKEESVSKDSKKSLISKVTQLFKPSDENSKIDENPKTEEEEQTETASRTEKGDSEVTLHLKHTIGTSWGKNQCNYAYFRVWFLLCGENARFERSFFRKLLLNIFRRYHGMDLIDRIEIAVPPPVETWYNVLVQPLNKWEKVVLKSPMFPMFVDVQWGHHVLLHGRVYFKDGSVTPFEHEVFTCDNVEDLEADWGFLGDFPIPKIEETFVPCRLKLEPVSPKRVYSGTFSSSGTVSFRYDSASGILSHGSLQGKRVDIALEGDMKKDHYVRLKIRVDEKAEVCISWGGCLVLLQSDGNRFFGPATLALVTVVDFGEENLLSSLQSYPKASLYRLFSAVRVESFSAGSGPLLLADDFTLSPETKKTGPKRSSISSQVHDSSTSSQVLLEFDGETIPVNSSQFYMSQELAVGTEEAKGIRNVITHVIQIHNGIGEFHKVSTRLSLFI